MNHEEIYHEFFNPLPEVVKDLHDIFEKHSLSQQQAACAAACALNQMVSVNGFPKFATVSLHSALQLNGK